MPQADTRREETRWHEFGEHHAMMAVMSAFAQFAVCSCALRPVAEMLRASDSVTRGVSAVVVPSFMKIAIATWFPRDPLMPRGGVEAVSVNLTRALARMEGNDVHVVTFDEGLEEPRQVEWEGSTIHRLPRTTASMFGFARGNGRRVLHHYLKQLRPDVVHSHDTFGIMTRGIDLPRVLTIHGFIYEDTRLMGGWKAQICATLWKHEELGTWAEQPHIISISPYVRERLRGIARGVIHDIDNPIDAACFEIRRREEAGRIFTAAVICRRKNPRGLVEAFLLLKPELGARLCLAGPVGEFDYDDLLRRRIHECGLKDRIELPGSLSAAAVKQELARATVFALVSFEEGAPMGIAEAMAAGVPVLTSNSCGMPYMVRHGETGFLIDPNRADEISRYLGLLLQDSQLRRKMGETARLVALERYHPDHVAVRTVHVYQQAILDFRRRCPRLTHTNCRC